jgi:hypothetical protein
VLYSKRGSSNVVLDSVSSITVELLALGNAPVVTACKLSSAEYTDLNKLNENNIHPTPTPNANVNSIMTIISTDV